MTVNETQRIRDAIDGTSNTIIISEQSGWSYTGDQPTNRTSNYYGGWSGARHLGMTIKSGTCSDLWQTGTTCVRWPPNSRRRFLAGLAGLAAAPLMPMRGSSLGAAEGRLVEAQLFGVSAVDAPTIAAATVSTSPPRMR